MSEIVRTCTVVDELVSDDGAVVLIEAEGEHRVLRLSVLGQLIRELASEGITIDRLVRELETRLGALDGDEAWSLTTTAVAALEAEGAVSVQKDHSRPSHDADRQDQPVGNGYRVPPHIAWASEDDGSVALADMRTGQRHSLNPSGGTIWTMTVAGTLGEAIESAIREAFPDAPNNCAEYIQRLLDSLVDAGLLEHRLESRPASD